MVKTLASHAGIRGSTPLGTTKLKTRPDPSGLVFYPEKVARGGEHERAKQSGGPYQVSAASTFSGLSGLPIRGSALSRAARD